LTGCSTQSFVEALSKRAGRLITVYVSSALALVLGKGAGKSARSR
jgi:hypothetical protein